MTIRTRVIAFAAVAAAAAVALIATGCGDEASADASGAPAEVATLIPADSPLYVELNTDPGDIQWSQALALAKRFPAYGELEQRFREELTEAGLDFDRDIRPLLGGRAAIAAAGAVDVAEATTPDGGVGVARDTGFIAVLQLEEGQDETVAELITREGDLVEAGEHNGVTYYRDDDDTVGAIADGFLVIADSERNLFTALDLIAGSGDALSGVDKFSDALDGLPEGALMRMYLDIGGLAKGSLESVDQIQGMGLGIQDIENAAMGAVALAEDDGVRVKGQLVGAGEAAAAAPEFTPTLTGQVPSDAVAYVGISDLATQLGAAVDQLQAQDGTDVATQLEQASGQLEAFLGITVDDLRALTSGEHAVVVRAEGSKAGVAGILQVEDGARAQQTLDSLRQALPGLAGLAGGAAGEVPELTPVPLDDGVTGWGAQLDDDVSLVYGVDGNSVLVGSSAGAVRAVQSPDAPLADDPDFVADTAGMPESVSALAWIDVQGLVDLLEANASLDAADAAQIAPLKSITMWSTGGSEPGFEAFLRIG
jgi:hypothetical protein